MDTKTLICVNCGCEFQAPSRYRPKKFCSPECQSENRRRIADWKKKLEEKQRREEEEKKLNNLSIEDIQKAAKASGMTYGQYTSKLYIQSMSIKRRVKTK